MASLHWSGWRNTHECATAVPQDTSLESQVAVFRVGDLSDPQKRFKVDVNAQQNNLTGGVLICKATNAAVVARAPYAAAALATAHASKLLKYPPWRACAVAP
jgi:hypothetical protein